METRMISVSSLGNARKESMEQIGREREERKRESGEADIKETGAVNRRII